MRMAALSSAAVMPLPSLHILVAGLAGLEIAKLSEERLIHGWPYGPSTLRSPVSPGAPQWLALPAQTFHTLAQCTCCLWCLCTLKHPLIALCQNRHHSAHAGPVGMHAWQILQSCSNPSSTSGREACIEPTVGWVSPKYSGPDTLDFGTACLDVASAAFLRSMICTRACKASEASDCQKPA